MKGDSSCHIPNDKYRDGWDRIFSNNIDKSLEYSCSCGRTVMLRRELDVICGCGSHYKKIEFKP